MESVSTKLAEFTFKIYLDKKSLTYGFLYLYNFKLSYIANHYDMAFGHIRYGLTTSNGIGPAELAEPARLAEPEALGPK